MITNLQVFPRLHFFGVAYNDNSADLSQLYDPWSRALFNHFLPCTRHNVLEGKMLASHVVRRSDVPLVVDEWSKFSTRYYIIFTTVETKYREIAYTSVPDSIHKEMR